MLPDSEPDMLVLRPLGGADDEIAAVFPDLETGRPGPFPPPAPDDLGDARAAGLLRTALRIGFRSSAGPFRSLASIAVEPRPYQLVPLLMAMRQPTVRLAICDDVGIGKTVESGLIAAELLAQGEASGLAVLCSPALAEQWQDELRTKFGIDAELILASTVPRLERALAYGESLFDTHQIVVISTDFIKSPRHRDDFVDHCPDLVIVDEAHTCVPADGGRRPDRRSCATSCCPALARDQSRHLLLVTATPHSGKDESFRGLIGLLDPDLADVDLAHRPGPPPAGRLLRAAPPRRHPRHYLERGHARSPATGCSSDDPYTLSPGYRALLDDAIAYASERVTTAAPSGTASSGSPGGRRSRCCAPWSPPRAPPRRRCSPAPQYRGRGDRRGGRRARPPGHRRHGRRQPDGIDASPGADDAARHRPRHRPRHAPRRRLRRARGARQRALEGPEQDQKLALLDQDRQEAARRRLRPDRLLPLHPHQRVRRRAPGRQARPQDRRRLRQRDAVPGAAARPDRAAGEAAEQEDGTRRVLVATDCLSEGVNLQHHFNAVVHYDLAWNPTRHEQREGRVDRFGQRSTTSASSPSTARTTASTARSSKS